MKITFILILILFTLSLTAEAQSDYIINLKGDTLRCKLTNPLFTDNGKYQTDTMRQARLIIPREVKEYYNAKENTLKRWVYVPGEKFPVYLTLIENGKLNLYETKNTYIYRGVKTTTLKWFIGKNLDTATALKSNTLGFGKSRKNRKDLFAELIMDNADVYKKYTEEDSFSFLEIRNLIHLYNTGQPFVDDRSIYKKISDKLETL